MQIHLCILHENFDYIMKITKNVYKYIHVYMKTTEKFLQAVTKHQYLNRLH
jgi:hypothetical protein